MTDRRVLAGVVVLVVALAVAGAFVLLAGGPGTVPPGASVSVTRSVTSDGVHVFDATVTDVHDADAVRLVGPRGDVVANVSADGGVLHAYPARPGTYRVVAVRGSRSRVVARVNATCTGFCPDVVVDASGGVGTTSTSLAIAVWHARPGDTVYVRNGTYYETYVGTGARGVVQDGLTIRGQSESGVVVEGNVTPNGKDLLYVENATGVTVSNVTFRADGDGGVTTYGRDTRLSNVRFANVRGDAVDAMARTHLSNVTVVNPGENGLYVAGDADGTTVTDTRLVGGTRAAFVDAGAAAISFRRTTFANASGSGLYVAGDPTRVHLAAASFRGNGRADVYVDDPSGVLDATGSYWGPRNVTADCGPAPSRLAPDPSRVNASDPRCDAP